MLELLLQSALFIACQCELDVLPDSRYPLVTLVDAKRFSHITREEARYHTQLALTRSNEWEQADPPNVVMRIDAKRLWRIWNHMDNALYSHSPRICRLESLDKLRLLLGDDWFTGIMPNSIPE